MSKNSNNLALNFLQFAVRNYISARILYMNNQLHDAGYMSHEAFEKVMKALLYFKNPTTTKYEKEHKLNTLRNDLYFEHSFNELKDAKDTFKYYEDCYSYRYPNTKQPKSFSTSTNKFKSLDNIFFYFHEQCLKEIADDEVRYISGIFTETKFYFQSGNPSDLHKIITLNNYFNKEYFDKAKDFWHSKGIFVQGPNGEMNLVS